MTCCCSTLGRSTHPTRQSQERCHFHRTVQAHLRADRRCDARYSPWYRNANDDAADTSYPRWVAEDRAHLHRLSSAMAQEAPAFNPLHVQWKNPELLAYLGAQKGGVKQGTSVLDESNVMEYFSTSPFYDRHSNNEHVRMQSAALIAQTIATTPQSGPELMATIARKHQEELKYVAVLTQALCRPRIRLGARPPSMLCYPQAVPPQPGSRYVWVLIQWTPRRPPTISSTTVSTKPLTCIPFWLRA